MDRRWDQLVSGGEVLSVDSEYVRVRAQSAAEKLFARRAALNEH
ncbi:hypothetical protein [Streptomyces sp. R35]|uniref:Uncharacterized protein n=1 Tax=Streptomyces sp. R35 TaxID=3238630 RepID=A0AB39SD23_9ACTN